MRIRKTAAITALSLAAAAAGMPAGIAAAAVDKGGPRGEVAIGEISVARYQQWCLTANSVREGGGVVIQRCTGGAHQQWAIARAQGLAVITYKDDPFFCLGVSLRNRASYAVLQDCATEDAHGSILRIIPLQGTNMWAISLANGKQLASPARLEGNHIYLAVWSEGGNGIYHWHFPVFRPANP